MIKEILSTMSDTELMVLANEVNEPTVSDASIGKQILSQSNGGSCNINIAELRDLSPILAKELSERLRSSNIQVGEQLSKLNKNV